MATPYSQQASAGAEYLLFIRLLATPSLTIASNFSAPQWHFALLELSGEPMALRK